MFDQGDSGQGASNLTGETSWDGSRGLGFRSRS